MGAVPANWSSLSGSKAPQMPPDTGAMWRLMVVPAMPDSASEKAVSALIWKEPVVLVDADVRAPDMHEIYDVPLCPGLTGVMLGECDLPSAIRATSRNW